MTEIHVPTSLFLCYVKHPDTTLHVHNFAAGPPFVIDPPEYRVGHDFKKNPDNVFCHLWLRNI